MIFSIIGNMFFSFPPAAQSLTVIVAVYTIMAAAKTNPWIKTKLTGWWSVAFNLVLTTLGLLAVVPANQLYSLNTVVSIAVSLLGSSGIHGMTKSIPLSTE